MDISIQKATKKDYQVIQQIEDNSFGVHIAFEEAQLIIEKDYGEVFIAYELEKPVGYQVVLFKEYDAETEAYLQPIIRRRKAQKEKVMHDDVNFDENRYVYFHLLGVNNEYQGKGIASLIKRHAKEIVLRRFPRKSVKICIRINNLPSIRVNMKTLGVYLESIKPNNWNILGSVETVSPDGNNPPILSFSSYCMSFPLKVLFCRYSVRFLSSRILTPSGRVVSCFNDLTLSFLIVSGMLHYKMILDCRQR